MSDVHHITPPRMDTAERAVQTIKSGIKKSYYGFGNAIIACIGPIPFIPAINNGSITSNAI